MPYFLICFKVDLEKIVSIALQRGADLFYLAFSAVMLDQAQSCCWPSIWHIELSIGSVEPHIQRTAWDGMY